jgi:hypothetical protein
VTDPATCGAGAQLHTHGDPARPRLAHESIRPSLPTTILDCKEEDGA